jgi:hypothetical protein
MESIVGNSVRYQEFRNKTFRQMTPDEKLVYCRLHQDDLRRLNQAVLRKDEGRVAELMKEKFGKVSHEETRHLMSCFETLSLMNVGDILALYSESPYNYEQSAPGTKEQNGRDLEMDRYFMECFRMNQKIRPLEPKPGNKRVTRIGLDEMREWVNRKIDACEILNIGDHPVVSAYLRFLTDQLGGSVPQASASGSPFPIPLYSSPPTTAYVPPHPTSYVSAQVHSQPHLSPARSGPAQWPVHAGFRPPVRCPKCRSSDIISTSDVPRFICQGCMEVWN